MILRTDRLTLRPLQSTDVEAIASHSLRPEFIRFLPLPPQTMESAAQFVEQAVANGQPDPKGDWLFAIQIREERSCPSAWCRSAGSPRSPAGLAGYVRRPRRAA